MKKLLLLMCLVFTPNLAQAQTIEDVVRVSQLTVNEASFALSNDHESITLVIKQRAEREGISPAEYIIRHHRRIGANRPWINGLNAEGTEPEGWPDSVSWEDYRGRWMDIQARVRATLAGQSRRECNAITWGSPQVDAERIARMVSSGKYAIVQCGVTRNTFLIRKF